MEFSRSNAQVATQAVGFFVRHTFYAVGLFALAFMGLVAFWVWNRLPPAPETVKAGPRLQIGADALSRRPQVHRAENHPQGWIESLQFGQLYDRDVDMTILMIAPTEAYQTLARNYASEIGGLRQISSRTYLPAAAFYDLETRFGSIRASEFGVNSDGRVKLCISYLSRFDSPAFYLKGWYCEANGARPSFSAVACILDQLTLKQPLRSAEATAFLTARMKQPARCYAEPVSQTTDTSPRRPLQRLIR